MAAPTSGTVIIISAMITPALLILGSGSLVATALIRLARAIDRARILLNYSEAERTKLGSERVERWTHRYARRSLIAERAVTAFFIAVGVFVIDGLAIAVNLAFADRVSWLPVGLTVLGMFLMLYGAYQMYDESRLAGLQIREEIFGH
jgi:hypothetical protein